MRRLALAAFLLTALLLAPRAHAANLERDYQTAIQYWDAAPTCTVELRAERPYLDDKIGEAAYPCLIRITPSLREPWACAVMAHEVGHLLGFEHSPNPRNIMHDGGRMVIPRLCRGNS